MKYLNVLRILISLMLILGGLLIWNADVQADVAPPSPPYAGNPVGGNGVTAVQMLSERVTFTIAPYSSYRNGQATVKALFQMHNQGVQSETMQVRFPLEWTGQGGSECIYSYTQLYPPINDLKAWVDGVPIATTTDFVTADISGANPTQVQVPCWANFPVTFPVGKDVNIQVQYTALGAGYLSRPQIEDDSWELGGDSPSARTSFNYILMSGAGWNGPIGKADIIFQFPYPVTQDALYYPSEADQAAQNMTISGDMLVWHKENFKPDRDIVIALVNPTVWLTIQEQSKIVQANPKNGEAWGLLGKAYEQVAWSRRGLGPASIVQKSEQAYRQAISLLPNDADWHFGFAELLCWKAMWHWEESPDWISCIQQLKTTLELRPGDNRALAVLMQLARINPGIVDLSGTEPIYSLLLTPSPIATSEPPTGTAEMETAVSSTTSTSLPFSHVLTSTVLADAEPGQEAITLTPYPSETFNNAILTPSFQPGRPEASPVSQLTPVPTADGLSWIWIYGLIGLIGLGGGSILWLFVIHNRKQ